MLADEIREALTIRENTNDNWLDGLERCWERETELLTRDISETIAFFEICSAEEFVLLSEVFDDVSERAQSREFIDCLYRIADKFPEETEKYRIILCIRFAEKVLGE